MLKLLPEKRERYLHLSWTALFFTHRRTALHPCSKQFSSTMEKLELVLTMRKYPESRRLLADYTMLNPHSDPHDFEYGQTLPCLQAPPPVHS